jgi:hypothetical protein
MLNKIEGTKTAQHTLNKDNRTVHVSTRGFEKFTFSGSRERITISNAPGAETFAGESATMVGDGGGVLVGGTWVVKRVLSGEGIGVGRAGVCTPILHCQGSTKGSQTQSSPL